MGQTTGITWTDHTFNPWRGCVKVAPECHSCYADKLSKRNPGTLGKWGSEASGGVRVVAAEKYWGDPIKWNAAAEKAGERRRVFCASLADVFEEWDGPMLNTSGDRLYVERSYSHATWETRETPEPLTMNDVRRRLFDLIDATPSLDWLVLTKRPENIRRMWSVGIPSLKLHNRPRVAGGCFTTVEHGTFDYRKNVWLGTSAGTQESADRFIPELAKCHALAQFLFVSCEPMLDRVHPVRRFETFVDWLIVGCESSSPGHVGRLGEFKNEEAWWNHADILADECEAAGVKYFFKQGPRDGKLVYEAEGFPQDFPCVTATA